MVICFNPPLVGDKPLGTPAFLIFAFCIAHARWVMLWMMILHSSYQQDPNRNINHSYYMLHSADVNSSYWGDSYALRRYNKSAYKTLFVVYMLLWNLQIVSHRIEHDIRITGLSRYCMMTSSNGNISRVTGHLCGEIHRSPVNPSHDGQWRGDLIFFLICAWINSWVNNHEAGVLMRHRARYDVIVWIPW